MLFEIDIIPFGFLTQLNSTCKKAATRYLLAEEIGQSPRTQFRILHSFNFFSNVQFIFCCLAFDVTANLLWKKLYHCASDSVSASAPALVPAHVFASPFHSASVSAFASTYFAFNEQT